QGVGRADALDVRVFGLRELGRRFLVRDRDAVAREGDSVEILQETRQFATRHPERNIDPVFAQLFEGSVVNQGAEAVSDRIADDAEHTGLSAYLLESVDVFELVGRQDA